MNHADARQARADCGENEFIKSESRFLLIHPVQIQPSLNGKTSRTQIVKIEPAVGLHRSFDVLGSLFDSDVPMPHELLQSAQSIGFIVLRLDFHRRAMMQGYRAPAQGFHIPHGVIEQLIVL